jgi:choline kinase
MTQALILAAGFGSRLRPLTDDRPKALVPVGGEPILGRALAALVDAGIKTAVVVTGYRQDAVREYLSHRADVSVATVENPDYASTNTLASLLVAAPLLDEDFLVIDGDLVFEPAVITRLVGPGVHLAVDTSSRLDDEAVKVAVSGDRILAVGKTLPPGLVAEAESIGIAHVDQPTAERLFQVGRELLDAGAKQAYYEAAFQRLIDEGAFFEAADVAGLGWVEVDNHQDLRRAESRFARR